MRAVLFLVCCFVILTAGCPRDNCTPNETRCFENRAQICNSEMDWQDIVNCTELGEWVCCWQPGDPDAGVPAGHTCWPGTVCP